MSFKQEYECNEKRISENALVRKALIAELTQLDKEYPHPK